MARLLPAWFCRTGMGERCDARRIELCLFNAGFAGLALTAELGSDFCFAVVALLIAWDG